VKRKAYIYPVTAFADKTIPNPYLDNLMDSLAGEIEFLNRKFPSNKGILDLTGFLMKIDLIFLNWIEDIPDKKGGWIQTLYFILVVNLLKVMRVRIIWTMHNKLSHYNTNPRLKKFLFRFLIRKSDFIITHSSEGIRYAAEYGVKNYRERMFYFPHPLENKFINFRDDPTYDALIWGSIIPYKGIDKFLAYLYENGLQEKFNIRIVGKVKPADYEEVIARFCNNSIIMDNRYVPEEELTGIISNSRAIIFTYAGESVLSSGVLMDSLSYGATVMAPDVGAFRDAGEEGLIMTFHSFDGLVELMNENRTRSQNQNEHIERFIKDSNWSRFAEKVSDLTLKNC